MLTEGRNRGVELWGDRLVRLFFFVYIVIAFPTGYVILEAFDGNAAAKALLLDPASFIAARSNGPRDPMPFATSKPAKARRDPPAADPGLAPPDTEAFLPPPGVAPEVPANSSPTPGDPDFPFGYSLAPGDSFDSPFGVIPDGGLPDFIVLAPIGPGQPVAPAPPIDPGPPLSTPSVPEPETWLIMIVGLVMTGAVLRRRNNTAGGRA